VSLTTLTPKMNSMKTTVIIDIGSNSVRKQVFSGGKILLRQTITTQLAKDVENKKLANKSINRTFEGLDELILGEKNQNTSLFAFATACVRNALNGKDFANEFFKKYGFNLEIISGEQEAELGILGALSGDDGSVIDVGGGSTEIATAREGKIIYAHSLQEGAVTLTDRFKKDFNATNEYLAVKFEEFADIKCENPLYAIGGTANTLAFIGTGLSEYDAEKSDGYKLTVSELKQRVLTFYELSGEQIAQRFNIDQKRARVIHSGANLLLHALMKCNAKEVILTENDNLRGYYLKKIEGKSYAK